jgi:hypothetical protein
MNRNLKYPLFLLLASLTLYSNTFKGGFVMDDKSQIIQNGSVHSVKNFPHFFVQGYSPAGGEFFYRPLLFASYSIFYWVGQGSPYVFHAASIVIFTLDTILVFYLLNKFFNHKTAFALSLLLLAHPVNEEIVSYVANLQDSLFILFGMASLLITFKKDLSAFFCFCASFLLFLSLLSKETGILFYIVMFLYPLLIKARLPPKTLIISNIFFVLIYIYLRNFSYKSLALVSQLNSAIARMPLPQRLLIIPKIIITYFNELFFPKIGLPDVKWMQTADIFQTIFLASLLLCVIVLTFILGQKIYRSSKKEGKVFYFFFIWFLTGILLHSQLIPLDVIYAKHWLIFPLIGLIGMIGQVVGTYYKKVPAHIKKAFKIMYLCYILVFCTEVFLQNILWVKLGSL